MERAIGLLLLLTLPIVAVTNLLKAVGFYVEKVGRITLYFQLHKVH
jgi:endonuclease III-like uncharacterized protein